MADFRVWVSRSRGPAGPGSRCHACLCCRPPEAVPGHLHAALRGQAVRGGGGRTQLPPLQVQQRPHPQAGAQGDYPLAVTFRSFSPVFAGRADVAPRFPLPERSGSWKFKRKDPLFHNEVCEPSPCGPLDLFLSGAVGSCADLRGVCAARRLLRALSFRSSVLFTVILVSRRSPLGSVLRNHGLFILFSIRNQQMVIFSTPRCTRSLILSSALAFHPPHAHLRGSRVRPNVFPSPPLDDSAPAFWNCAFLITRVSKSSPCACSDLIWRSDRV